MAKNRVTYDEKYEDTMEDLKKLFGVKERSKALEKLLFHLSRFFK